jgi:hypothetical protein
MLQKNYFLMLGLSAVVAGLGACTVTTTPSATTPSPSASAKASEAPKAEAPKADASAKPTEAPKPDAAKSDTKPASDTKPTALKVAAKPKAQSLANTPEFDKIVADIAKSLDLTDYSYEAYALPPTEKWEDTLSYYDGELKKAGWSGEGKISDIDGGGKVGAFVSKETKSGVVILFIPSPDGTKPAVDLAIIGSIK